MERNDLITIAVNMAKKEKEYAESVKDTAKFFRHPLIKVLIEAISLDSEKHHLLFNALAQLFEQKALAPVVDELLTLPREDINIVISMIRDHIRVETEMIETVKKLLGRVKDKDIKTVLSYIYDDEVRHHKLLTDIEQKIITKYEEKREE